MLAATSAHTSTDDAYQTHATGVCRGCPCYGRDGHNDHDNDPKGVEIIYEGSVHDLHHVNVVKVGCFKDRSSKTGRKLNVLYRHEDDDDNATFTTETPEGDCRSWMHLYESSRDGPWTDIQWH